MAQLGVKFSERQIESDETALALAKELGFLSAPVILVQSLEGDTVEAWAGFQPEKIEAYA